MTKLSPNMRRCLDNLVAGKAIGAHCRGQAEHGGLTGTVAALHRRGLIDGEGKITDEGRQALGLCVDEGCPHHGTTHVCNPSR